MSEEIKGIGENIIDEQEKGQDEVSEDAFPTAVNNQITDY